ncbi:MAG: hypothetical protein N3D14_03235, partial [Aquificaceae bacterium]|nr:hypothetical protein [Aquificaceae bacterium]
GDTKLYKQNWGCRNLSGFCDGAFEAKFLYFLLILYNCCHMLIGEFSEILAKDYYTPQIYDIIYSSICRTFRR